MDDAERLPCLATLAPHAAATTDAAAEKLTVWWPSPPVPTMSTHGTPGPVSCGCASRSPSLPPLARSRPWPSTALGTQPPGTDRRPR
eukprot:scaffold39015_cov72-Phaeocystis_antarctica.AAC.1